MYRALSYVRLTGLLIVHNAQIRGIQLNGLVLEVGPDGSRDQVATIGVRRYLYPSGRSDERHVRQAVESLGYAYVPVASGIVLPVR